MKSYTYCVRVFFTDLDIPCHPTTSAIWVQSQKYAKVTLKQPISQETSCPFHLEQYQNLSNIMYSILAMLPEVMLPLQWTCVHYPERFRLQTRETVVYKIPGLRHYTSCTVDDLVVLFHTESRSTRGAVGAATPTVQL